MGKQAAAASEIFITEHSLFSVCLVLLIVAWCFIAPVIYIRVVQKTWRKPECLLMAAATIIYTVYMINWLVVLPAVYRVNYVALGMIKLYPSFLADLSFYIDVTFAESLLNWTILWSVKFSLLFLYRSLMRGLPVQLKWWWAVAVYVACTYIFSIVTTFTSCGGPVRMVNDPTQFCHRSIDNFTRNLSFYGAFACDVTTDLLIMILPIRLIWKVQIPLRRKLGIGAMFCVALFSVFTAVIRLVQINSKTGSTNPNNEWIILWGAVEATTAIVVGCIPSYRYYRAFRAASQKGTTTYYARDYQPYAGNEKHHSSIHMSHGLARDRRTGSSLDSTSDDDTLATGKHDSEGITVKTTYEVSHDSV